MIEQPEFSQDEWRLVLNSILNTTVELPEGDFPSVIGVSRDFAESFHRKSLLYYDERFDIDPYFRSKDGEPHGV